MRIEPKIACVKRTLICSGLTARVAVKNVYREIPKMLDAYQRICGRRPNDNIKRPWQYISLSTNYGHDMSWEYYTGHVVSKYEGEPEGLTHFEIPRGDYAVFEIRFKSAMFFALNMGRIKKYIYQKWLPTSGYRFSGYEYEYSDEAMKKNNPFDIDLYVGIDK